ncbi:MFS transporter [Ramlibacter monticola]|uniref:MFS transporter n=1 Tax=Ramlibacter monticola TaxID=1926872 RepID=A0A937CPQ7_9BURK|nr:MFS transporter [Ramlibacter monticola]MBL0389940.1 MFS transporter [Ramlibacter monticola]
MSTSAPTLAPAVPLSRDAGVIGLVGLAHMVSHFSQLLLPSLFPWLKDALAVSYTELAFLMTIFFVVSCAVQAASGFLVDHFGPRPILFGGLALLALGAFGFAASPNYATMMLCVVVAGTGNGVFHPADYTLINRKVSPRRLGHAYSVHGITGSLGWALAPALMVPLAIAFHWRVALAAGGCVALAVLAVLWVRRAALELPPAAPTAPAASAASAARAEGSFDFLRIPAVWMCFSFFFVYAGVLSGVQAYAPEAARQLHQMPVAMLAACVTTYMVCSAAGVFVGGFLASDPGRCERVVGAGCGVAALIALALGVLDVPALAVPVLFGAMGIATGVSGPSRDLLVKRSTPENASGRVFGVVYSGLDIGQALAPLVFAALIDHRAFVAVWLVLALLQLLMIASAVSVRRVRRGVLAMA